MAAKKNFETNSYCVGSGNPRKGIKGHYSPTKNIVGHIAKNGKKYLQGTCTVCGRTKSVFVSDSTVVGEGLGSIFQHLGKLGKKVGKNIAKNPEKALNVAMNLGMAGATKNPAAILTAGTQAGKFLATGKGVRIGTLTDGSGLYLTKPR
ncbi:MAG: hypothetical protein AAGG81_08650 [Chlamydiota bacterium]